MLGFERRRCGRLFQAIAGFFVPSFICCYFFPFSYMSDFMLLSLYIHTYIHKFFSDNEVHTYTHKIHMQLYNKT